MIIYIQTVTGQELIGTVLRDEKDILTLNNVFGVSSNPQAPEQIMFYPATVAVINNFDAHISYKWKNIVFEIEEDDLTEEMVETYKKSVSQVKGEPVIIEPEKRIITG